MNDAMVAIAKSANRELLSTVRRVPMDNIRQSSGAPGPNTAKLIRSMARRSLTGMGELGRPAATCRTHHRRGAILNAGSTSGSVGQFYSPVSSSPSLFWTRVPLTVSGFSSSCSSSWRWTASTSHEEPCCESPEECMSRSSRSQADRQFSCVARIPGGH